ncbi:hypothetical protein NFI88_07630 [Acetobacteraceae bacterium KSS12]|uniref:Uncharacterized protein n=1 Tax=Rhizosaccharibacter radicis TaxID=2782605 RepID=A0ABT1VWJ7_9PROT|nr:hypothetical protein [Acetobacteraceae bacterium KSS12]
MPRERWQRLFDEVGVRRPGAPIHSGSVATIRGLLACSDFLSLLSRDQSQVEIDAGLLTVIASQVPETMRMVDAIARRDWFPTATPTRFLTLLREAARGR